jgi:probable rRNA maturation factor
MPSLRLDLDYASPLWTNRRPLGQALRRAGKAVFLEKHVARATLPHPACQKMVIAVKLTDDAEMQALNSTFRGMDKATNVLSFPSRDDEVMQAESFLGNIAIGYETVEREAAHDGKIFQDHLMHLLVHGCLHLVGYDHVEQAEAEEMEALETDILASLGLADPYADFDLVQQARHGA